MLNILKHKYTARILWAASLIYFVLLVYKGAAGSGYQWDWAGVGRYFFDFSAMRSGPILKGLGVSFQIITLSLLFTFIIGFSAALSRLFGSPLMKALAKIYLEVIRNTPLLVQLSIVYFIFGSIFNFSTFWAAVIALSLFEGAYLSEILRSGFIAVDEGQWQAAWCLGLSTPRTFYKIIIPQAAPMLLPPLFSLIISLVKDSALASTIAVYEMTKEARDLVAETFQTFEIWLTVAAVYLIINLALSFIGARMEKPIMSQEKRWL